MRKWLAALAVAPFVVATASHAQTEQPNTSVGAEPAFASDLKLRPDQQFVSSGPLKDGMLAQDDVASNATLAIGLAHMSGRPARSLRWTGDAEPTRNPGVSFVLKF